MNILDIFLILLIALVFFLALRKIHRDRKNGRSCLGCGGNCNSCGLDCRQQKKKEIKP